MQIKGLHHGIYRLAKYACKVESAEQLAAYRQKYLKHWEILKGEGLDDQTISEITGISRSTYYRRKKALKQYGAQGLKNRSQRPHRTRCSQISDEAKRQILHLRRANPTYGKIKLRHLLERDHQIVLSESTVGRMLSDYFKRGLLVKYAASRKRRRPRYFTGHAKRWSYGQQAQRLGELIQVDHMSVSKNQTTIKHFQAWDPVSKMIVAQCYSRATSRCAADFLEEMLRRFPFKVHSIQVDGGSEFRCHFEDACRDKGIPLYVLPPKSPKLNGGVERGNRIFREDFYNQPLVADTVGSFRIALRKALDKYNHYRPHQALKCATPFEYTQRILGVTSQSQTI